MSLKGWLPPKEITSPRGAWTALANKRKGRPDRASAMLNSRVSPGIVGSRSGTDVIAPATGEVKGIFNWLAPTGDSWVLYRDGSVIRALNQPATLMSILNAIGTMYRPSFSDLLTWVYFCGSDTTGAGTTQVRIFDTVNVDKAFRGPLTNLVFTGADSGVGQSTLGTHNFGFVYQNRTGYSGAPTTTDINGNPMTVTLSASLRKITITVQVPAQLDGGTNASGEIQATLFLIASPANNPAAWFFVPTAVSPSTSVIQQPVPFNQATTLTFIYDLSDQALYQADSALNNFNLLHQDSSGNGPIAPQFIAPYGTRMMYANGTTLFASDLADPQSITGDLNQVFLPNQRYIGAGFALPGGTSFYIMGDHWTVYVTDNTDNPATWPVPLSVSQSLGAPLQNCICYKTGGNYAWVVTEGGPYLFNGAYDEKPISYLVSDQWKRVNWQAAYAIEIADDSANLRLYIAVPLDGSTEPTAVFVFDYQNGMEFDTVDFSIDTYNPQFFATFGSIGVVKEVRTDETNLWIGPTGPNQPSYPITIQVTDVDGNVATVPCFIDVACPPLGVLVAEGDSITYGAYLPAPSVDNYAFLAINSFETTYAYYNDSVGGSRTGTVISRLPTDLLPFSMFGGQKIFSLMIGSNDLGNDPNATPAAIFAAIQTILNTVISQVPGVTCIVLTILPGNFVLAGPPPLFEIRRQAFNALLRSGTAGPPSYILADPGNDLIIGQAGQNFNPTYYQADGIHPTIAGQQIISTYLRAALVTAGFGP